jgi:flagellar basal-body rod modification protein FlgD
MNTLSAPTPRPNTPTTTTTNSPSKAPLSDYNTYLRMLTTQMRYQDPLDPINASDYAAQLAAFSTVEQQVATNAHLKSLNDRFDLLGMAQLSGWVGQEALTKAAVHFDGTPVTLQIAPDKRADTAVLVVKDRGGNVVSRETVPLAEGTYRWLGGDATGKPLREGTYTLTLESQRDGQVITTTPVQSYAPITEARRGTDGIILRLKGGVDVPASEVTALRKP